MLESQCGVEILQKYQFSTCYVPVFLLVGGVHFRQDPSITLKSAGRLDFFSKNSSIRSYNITPALINIYNIATPVKE